jgi:hypothetical protein
MRFKEIINNINDVNTNLSDKEIFKTKDFSEYLKSISSDLFTKFNIEQNDLILIWNESETREAFTKSDLIYINSTSKIIRDCDSNIQKLKIYLGLYCHEIGHILYTDFFMRKLFEESMLQGIAFPNKFNVENDTELNENRIQMLEYFKDSKKSVKLSAVLLFLYDLIEDGRIEELMYKYCSNYGRLIEGLNVLRSIQYKKMSNCNIDLVNNQKFYYLLNHINYYSKFRKFKGINEIEGIGDIDCKSVELINKFNKIAHLIDRLIEEPSSIKRVEFINNIAVLNWDDIKLYIDRIADKNSEGEDLSEISLANIVRDDLNENTEVTSETGESMEILNLDKEVVESKEDSTEIEADNKNTASNDSCEDESAAKLNTNKKDSSEESETLSRNPGDIDNLIGEITETTQNDNAETNLPKYIKNQIKSISYGDIHKGLKVKIHHPEVTQNDKEQYEQISKEYIEVANQLALKVMPLLEPDKSSDYTKNRYYGAKFNAFSLVNRDFRYFSRKNPPNESPSVALGLRVDESSSMTSQNRVEVAKAAAITLMKFCHKCDIPVAVYGDTADVSNGENLSIYSYADFERVDSNDLYRVMKISPKNNNRDGAAIKIMSERLLTVDADIKLLFIISDGQPMALPDYSGENAEEDMKKIVSEYTRKGITFFAAAIGQDKEVIKRIYGEERFLDISDLNNLPNRLAIILKNIL